MKSKSFFTILFALCGALLQSTAAQAQVASGQRQLANAIIEPAYDYRTGEPVYIMTHEGIPQPPRANVAAQSPLFLVVYPNSAAMSVGTMNCAHEGGDNCPDHGPTISAIAQGTVPAVYGNGVWGHDHLLGGTGADDFNVTRRAVVVLFTTPGAANEHITTQSQLDAALDAGDAITIEIPVVLHGNLVSGATYEKARPLQ